MTATTDLTAKIAAWHEEARYIDEEAGNYPHVAFKVMYGRATKDWHVVTNGVRRVYDTRKEALTYLSALLLAMSTHDEPDMEAYYLDD